MIFLLYAEMEDSGLYSMQHLKSAELAQCNKVHVLQVALYIFQISKTTLRVGLIYTQLQ